MTDHDGFNAVRRRHIQRNLRSRARRFARRYDRARPTVLLVPGSTGSRLDRSTLPYYELTGSRPARFDPVWLDMGALLSDIRYLEIAENGEDADGHCIVANGPFSFFFSPYDEMLKFFRRREFNFAVFCYDWRRSPGEAAEFLEFFLEQLAAEVVQLHGTGSDPRPRLTFACHSLGGIVALLFLHRLRDRLQDNPQAIAEWVQCVITIGTPFYGTGSALQRYYLGMPFFNERYGADTIARVIGSFPGGPVAHFLDCATYREYVQAFRDRGEPPELSRYPSRDGTDPAMCELDPYAEHALQRYPPWKQRAHVAAALAVRRQMQQTLPDAFLSRLFHIRATGLATCSEIRWSCGEAPDHRPGSPGPFEMICGTGDGVVPTWSARLCHTASTQVWDIAAEAEHGFLMEDRLVLAAVEHVSRNRALPPEKLNRQAHSRGRKVAPEAYVRTLADKLADGTLRSSDPVVRTRSVWRTLFRDVLLG